MPGDTDTPDDTNFTPDQWRRIREYARASQNGNAREAILRSTKHTDTSHITKDKCRRIRELRHNGTLYIDIASKLEIGTSAARYHALAECTHNVEIPPVPKKQTTDGGDA